MSRENLESAYSKLDHYVKSENFTGYDPYDTLTSSIPFKKWGKWPPILAIQFQKRNPWSFRKILGIKKEVNPKGIGLFLHSYSLEYQRTKDEKLRPLMDELFQLLLSLRTKDYDEYCWGYNFDWASPVKFLKAYSPTIVASVFIAKGIYEYYLATNSEKAKSVLFSVGDFILNQLEVTEDETGICYSYSVEMVDCCYNASMLGCEHFARLYHLSGDVNYKEMATRSASFVVNRQKENGSWNYSINYSTQEERNQIDFHQGYILDSLHYHRTICNDESIELLAAIKKGLKFYKSHQFTADGRALWRLPKKWPADIHNQAQGIITFSRLKEYSGEYLQFAKTVANWTVNNMQDLNTGHMIYKKYPSHKVKTPMMRWGQGWMHLALNELKTALDA